MEMRNKLDISSNDSLEIYVEGTTIMLKKYQPDCVFCGSSKNVTPYKGKNVCEKYCTLKCDKIKLYFTS